VSVGGRARGGQRYYRLKTVVNISTEFESELSLDSFIHSYRRRVLSLIQIMRTHNFAFSLAFSCSHCLLIYQLRT
jgi:hypothetical protein